MTVIGSIAGGGALGAGGVPGGGFAGLGGVFPPLAGFFGLPAEPWGPRELVIGSTSPDEISADSEGRMPVLMISDVVPGAGI